MNNEAVTVRTTINAPVEQVWHCYTDSAHIVQWNTGSPDWHTPRAQNDLRVGGKFLSRMEAKDGSAGFDFTGTYTEVLINERIAYVMDGPDQRHAMTVFGGDADTTTVAVAFEPEHENPIEMQRGGWQTILDNFKRHVESEHAHG